MWCGAILWAVDDVSVCFTGCSVTWLLLLWWSFYNPLLLLRWVVSDSSVC